MKRKNEPARTQNKNREQPRKSSAPSRSLDTDILPTLIGYNIRRAQIALWRDFARSIQDIRPGMFSALALIRANPGIAQVELATELSIDKASTVSLVDRLEDAGWIVRTRSQEDRRRQGLTLTAAGEKSYRSLKREMLDHEEKFAALYTDSERKQLLSLLRRLHDADQERSG